VPVLTRRELLASAAAATAVVAVAVTVPRSPTSSGAAGPFRAYTSDSFFKSGVLGAPVDSVRTTAFRSFMKAHPDQIGTSYPVIRGVGGDQLGMPYAMGLADDPVWKLTDAVPSTVEFLKTSGFIAPEYLGAILTGTSDSPFVVIDRANGMTVWGAQAKLVGPHLISVGAAGAFSHASNGLDRRNPGSDSNSNFRSRGAIPDAMVIRRDLVDWGIANNTDLGHVLHLFMVETLTADGYCHPMVGDESSKHGFGAEGERIAISPTVNVAARGLSPTGLVIARTLQNYGAYFGDNAGAQTALKAEQTSSARDVWSTKLTASTLKNITWDDFVVLPQGWQEGRAI